MVCLQDVQVYCHALFMFSLADLLELFVDLSPENPMQWGDTTSSTLANNYTLPVSMYLLNSHTGIYSDVSITKSTDWDWMKTQNIAKKNYLVRVKLP